jgi:hypothetical protein
VGFNVSSGFHQPDRNVLKYQSKIIFSRGHRTFAAPVLTIIAANHKVQFIVCELWSTGIHDGTKESGLRI